MTDCCLNCKYHKEDFLEGERLDICTYEVYLDKNNHGNLRKKVSPNGWCKDWQERRKEQ